MDNKSAIKLACPRALARLPIMGPINPVAPTKMLSMVDVHDFLSHSWWMDEAITFVKKNPNATLRELQTYIVGLSKKDVWKAKYYASSLWMYDRVASVKRALHEDADGNFFVKHDSKWKAVFPIDRFGSLIWTSHGLKPITGYFCPSLSRVGRPHTF